MGVLRSLFKPNIERLERNRDVAGLIKALQYPELEEQAVRSLGRLGGATAIEIMVKLLESERPGTRMASVEALGETADPSCVKPLAELLRTSGAFMITGVVMHGWSSRLRLAAAKGLGRVANEDAIKALIGALGHDDDMVRAGVVSALHSIGKPAVGLLAGALGASDDSIRLGAVFALDGIRDEKSIAALAGALRDDDGKVRERAAKALDDFGWRPANDTERAYYLIAKGDYSALMALGERAVEPLIHALGYSDPSARRFVPGWLGNIGDNRAVGPLIEHLKGRTQRHIVGRTTVEDWCLAKAEAAEALGKIGDPSAVKALLEELKYPARDRDERRIHSAATEALARIARTSPVGLQALIEAVKDSSELRSRAAEALQRLGWQPRDVEEQAWYLLARGDREGLVALGENAVGPLAQALRDARGEWRIPAISAAGDLGHPDFVEPLLQLLRESNTDYLMQQSVVDALGRVGSTAVEPLIKLLSDEDRVVRSAAAKALGGTGDERAVGPLGQAYEHDEDDLVRASARNALWALKKEGS